MNEPLQAPPEPASALRVLLACIVVLALAAGLNPSAERHQLALAQRAGPAEAAAEPAYRSLGFASYTLTAGAAGTSGTAAVAPSEPAPAEERVVTIGAFGWVHVVRSGGREPAR